ncbi:hypothetical protein OC835_006379 [Tilletia horrida]|nr:hypothetical protein OC835_006379 [Tilletia horrida]
MSGADESATSSGTLTPNPRQQQQQQRMGPLIFEGSPLQSVYVPAASSSSTLHQHQNQHRRGSAPGTGPATGSATPIAGADGAQAAVPAEAARSLAVLRRKVEHELEVQRAARPRLATTLSLLSEWDGRDALLALTQSLLLAAHHALSLPPPKRDLVPGYFYLRRALPGLLLFSAETREHARPKPRPTKTASTHTLKQIYLAQEVLSSLRRCLLVGRWISDLALEASARFGSAGDKGGAAADASKEDFQREKDALIAANAPASQSGLILDPPVSLTDVARLAQHGLALEGVLPLAGTTASRTRKRTTQPHADGVAAEASGARSSSRAPGTGGAAASQTSSSRRVDDGESVSSSVPQTLRRSLLPFGEIRPSLQEGEDAVFASSLGGTSTTHASAAAPGDAAPALVTEGVAEDLEPGQQTIESSWAMVHEHTEDRRHARSFIAGAQSTARTPKSSTEPEDDDTLQLGQPKRGHLAAPAEEDGVDDEESYDDDSGDDILDEEEDDHERELQVAVPHYNADEEALLNVDDVDPTDLSKPLPLIAPSTGALSSSSFPPTSSRARAVSSALEDWLAVWEERLEALLFSAGTLAELADVLAFFSGTSLAWRWFRRTYVGRLSPHLAAFPSSRTEGALISRRQRHGLERAAVWLSALCSVLSLILVRIKRNRAKRRRREVARRFRAVMDGMEWREAMQARALASGGVYPPHIEGEDGEQQLATLTRAQRAFLTYDGALGTLTTHIRWLARERWATLGESGFLFYEILRPGADKEGWEAWTGIVGGLVRVGRMWTEHFTGRSVS